MLDISVIRLGNVKDILNCFQNKEGLTKRDIESLTSLSFSTISNICNLLHEKGILVEKRNDQNLAGRAGKKYYLEYNSFLTLCINLEFRKSVSLSIVNFRNIILFHQEYEISKVESVYDVLSFTYSIFNTLQAKLSWLNQAHFLGVGIIVSGIFDTESKKIVCASVPALENVPIKAIAEEIFKMPCYVENNSNLCAISLLQRSSQVKDLVYMHISQGVGVGIIAGGHLLTGYHGYAGEIAHIPLGKKHKICPVCGQTNCIEPELCLTGLLDNDVYQTCEGPLEKQWSNMFDDMKINSQKYTEFFHDKSEIIGNVLSLLVNLFDPQEIWLGGEIVDILPFIQPTIEDEIRQHSFLLRDHVLPLRSDKNCTESMVLGMNFIMNERWNPLTDVLYTVEAH